MLFVVHGTPIPLKRSRVAKRRFYNPQKKEMANVAWNVKSQVNHSFTPFAEPLKLVLEFYMPIPTSISKKRQKDLVANAHWNKPDLSNLIKFIEDALNGIVWEDDRYIYSIDAKKFYSPEPKTIIYVSKVK